MDQIQVEWVALTSTEDTGASAITSYVLEMYDPTESTPAWAEVVGQSSAYTSLSYTVTGAGAITAGETYQFRVTAQNALGDGAVSSTVNIIPSSVPSKMAVVTTEVSSIFVKISWDEPSANGAAITAYRLYIKGSDNVYHEEQQFCTQQSDYDNLNCLVVMSTLEAPPFQLSQTDLVEVQIQAYNLKGYGELSDANTIGAVVEGEPQAP